MLARERKTISRGCKLRTRGRLCPRESSPRRRRPNRGWSGRRRRVTPLVCSAHPPRWSRRPPRHRSSRNSRRVRRYRSLRQCNVRAALHRSRFRALPHPRHLTPRRARFSPHRVGRWRRRLRLRQCRPLRLRPVRRPRAHSRLRRAAWTEASASRVRTFNTRATRRATTRAAFFFVLAFVSANLLCPRTQEGGSRITHHVSFSAFQRFSFSLAREVLIRYFTGHQKPKNPLANSSPCAYNAKHEKETDQLSLAPGFGSINTVRCHRDHHAQMDDWSSYHAGNGSCVTDGFYGGIT
jgi:hypothetical protein